MTHCRFFQMQESVRKQAWKQLLPLTTESTHTTSLLTEYKAVYETLSLWNTYGKTGLIPGLTNTGNFVDMKELGSNMILTKFGTTYNGCAHSGCLMGGPSGLINPTQIQCTGQFYHHLVKHSTCNTVCHVYTNTVFWQRKRTVQGFNRKWLTGSKLLAGSTKNIVLCVFLWYHNQNFAF